MKRILRYTLMLLSAGLVFAACSGEEEITPAPMPTGAQVFFGNELPTAYEINPEESSISITVSRAEAGSALTVPVKATTESDKYTIPANVSFAAGETTAQLPVSYVPADIEYGKYEKITLTLGDEGMATPYGYSSYSFTIGVTDWTDWGPWNSAGTATYKYTGTYWSGDDEGLPFVYRQNVIKPNLYQFKLSKWGNGVDIVFEYDEATGDVTCAQTYTGLEDASGYGPLYVANFNYYQGVVRGKVAGVDFTPAYGEFDKEEGIIAIPMSYYVSAGTFGAAYEYIYIDGYTRADVSCAISYAGKFTAVDESVFVVADVQLGADVTSAYVALVPGDPTDEDAAAIIAGEYENMVEIDQSGEVKFPTANMADGKYTFVVVSFLGDEAKNMETATFKYEAVAGAWKSLGMATYTEDCLGPLYCPEEEDPTDYVSTYEVEIQENQNTPGLYRLKNPYGEAYPLNNSGEWDATRDYYMEINACDPDGVFIEAQEMGVDWGNGVFTIYSMGAYYMDKGYSFDEVKAQGVMGKLENGVITFPVKGLLAAIGEDGWYYGNTNGATKIVLPGAAGVKAAKSAKKSVVKRSVKQEKAQVMPLLHKNAPARLYNRNLK